jgi:hypothetical protein
LWAGMLTNIPGRSSIGSSPSNLNWAAPFRTRTHSFLSWSYQKPSGELPLHRPCQACVGPFAYLSGRTLMEKIV